MSKTKHDFICFSMISFYLKNFSDQLLVSDTTIWSADSFWKRSIKNENQGWKSCGQITSFKNNAAGALISSSCFKPFFNNCRRVSSLSFYFYIIFLRNVMKIWISDKFWKCNLFWNFASIGHLDLKSLYFSRNKQNITFQ